MKWIKNFIIIVSVYCLATGITYFSIVPSNPHDWETHYFRTASLWFAIPITILIMFIWNKLVKKFNL